MDVPAGFWLELSTARRALLALDYDGTLAPFRAERDAARPFPRVAALLGAICRHTDTRLVVISGRPPRAVARLLGLAPPPEIWGGHGWERLTAAGDAERRPVPAAARRALAAAAQDAAAAGGRDRRAAKPARVARPWRGDPEPARLAAAARALLAPHADDVQLELLSFAAGLELRCRGWDKGRALQQLLDEEPGAAVAYLGDDRTDEDAFRALAARPGGLPLLVAAAPRPTAAAGRLVPPDDLCAFLARWRQERGSQAT